MKRLLGIMAVVALLAGPAMGGTQTASIVTITVAPYCEIGTVPALSFTVSGPYVPGANYGDSKDFNVLCNKAANLKVTCTDVTLATAAPGQPAVDYYPTARDTSGNGLGFGVALTNKTSGQYGAWNCLDNPNGKAEVSIAAPVLKANLPNANITVNSYADSAREGKALALAGNYSATLTLTISVP